MSDTTLHPAFFKTATTQRSGWNPHGLRFADGADPDAGGGDGGDSGGPDETGTGGDDQQDQPTDPPKRSLEDLLSGLDDEARAAVLGQVSSARSEAKGLRRRLKEAEPKVKEYDRLAAASKTDLERSQERTSTLANRLVRAEIKAAAGEFADPADAFAFLIAEKGGLEGYVDADDEVDADQIAEDLADLLERKPHLRKQREVRVPKPNPALGASGGGSGTPSADEQIKEAQSKGDWRRVLHLQNQKLAEQAGK